MKIVTVCPDCYADTAPAFVDLIRSKWPTCPYEIVFITNTKRLDVGLPVVNITGKPDMAFGWRLRQFLKDHYDEEHLLIMMSDYFISGIDPALVARAHELCATDGIRHVRLRPMPRPQMPFNEPGFGCIDKRRAYSLSLQPGIWETEVLYRLCRDTENAWETETRGSGRVKNIDGLFLTTDRNAISHKNYYKKERPDRDVVNWVRDNVSPEHWPKAARDK